MDSVASPGISFTNHQSHVNNVTIFTYHQTVRMTGLRMQLV